MAWLPRVCHSAQKIVEVFRDTLNGCSCRGVSHAHRAHQSNLPDSAFAAAVARLDHGTVAQGGVGMLPADPDPVITTGLAGDEGSWVAIHQIQEGAHFCAVAEFGLCHQS